MRRSTPIIAVATLAWVGGTAWGFHALARHAAAPGAVAPAATSWPASSRLERAADRPTLVLFAHPKCPCTRATLGELERLVARAQGRLAVRVAFFAPADAPSSWAETDTWRHAGSIPGVATVVDPAGIEAERFGALTSGDAFLYDRRGELVFRGGITSARGHSGDNAGRAAIEAFVLEGRAPEGTTSVFGCSLLGAPARSDR